MRYSLIRSVVLAGLLLAMSSVAVASQFEPALAYSADTGRPEQVVLRLDEASEGPALSNQGSDYLSPVVEAERPFTHMMPRWEASGPVSDTLTIEVRSSLDNKDWEPWVPVLPNEDMWVYDDGDEVFWGQIIYAGEGARFWQVRALVTPTADGREPVLRQIDVNTVDARFGDDLPTVEPVGNLASAGRPPVVSRTAWGSPDGQRSRVPPAYYPVNHMVVHHTVDPNTFRAGEQSWADRVRAIWSFHTFTRGWGDIGYNYLVAPDGTVFEGRAGGDDAVGFHDTANYGSMGVAMVGTFSSVAPTLNAQNSLVSLLAWKANQKGIDPLGRSYYYGCDISRFCDPHTSGAVVMNIAGHRHVTPGRTTCPGEMTVALLASLRNRVQAAMETGVPDRIEDDGNLIIDELETTFARSDANWYTSLCGYGGNTFYTFATNNAAESTNSATWRPDIPTSGRYKVYASIPQACGLAANQEPSGTTRYKVVSADGEQMVTVNQTTSEPWVDLGTYTFEAGTNGAVELSDLTDEPFSEQRVIFFDTIKWVPIAEVGAEMDLIDVRYSSDTVAVGELLQVTFVVQNDGGVTVAGQGPEAGTRPDGSYDPANSYVYDEGECFLGAEGQNYPIFDKETERFRATLGPTNRTLACAGETGGYPWRWGINGELAPGETREVVGYVRFREPGQVTLQAGLIQEYVRYHARDIASQTITVLPERRAPSLASYDELLRPEAEVYHLGDVPDNLLARTANPLSIPRGDYLGSFPWNGALIQWGSGGPLGQSERFVVQQTRLFRAPASGTYAFRTTSDDGSWLWVNGSLAVSNHGLHDVRTITGTMQLEAGLHTLSFLYFERTGSAAAGYELRAPGEAAFGPVVDALSEVPRFAGTFRETPELTLTAHDQGGTGIATMRYSWDGETWMERNENPLRLGNLAAGSYTLRYQAIDAAGNASPEAELRFNVDPNQRLERLYLPVMRYQTGTQQAFVPYPEPQ